MTFTNEQLQSILSEVTALDLNFSITEEHQTIHVRMHNIELKEYDLTLCFDLTVNSMIDRGSIDTPPHTTILSSKFSYFSPSISDIDGITWERNDEQITIIENHIYSLINL